MGMQILFALWVQEINGWFSRLDLRMLALWFQWFCTAHGAAFTNSVLEKSPGMGSPENLMLCGSSTRGEWCGKSKNSPEQFLFGRRRRRAQGWSLAEVANTEEFRTCGLLFNSSRGNYLCFRREKTCAKSCSNKKLKSAGEIESLWKSIWLTFEFFNSNLSF